MKRSPFARCAVVIAIVVFALGVSARPGQAAPKVGDSLINDAIQILFGAGGPAGLAWSLSPSSTDLSLQVLLDNGEFAGTFGDPKVSSGGNVRANFVGLDSGGNIVGVGGASFFLDLVLFNPTLGFTVSASDNGGSETGGLVNFVQVLVSGSAVFSAVNLTLPAGGSIELYSGSAFSPDLAALPSGSGLLPPAFELPTLDSSSQLFAANDQQVLLLTQQSQLGGSGQAVAQSLGNNPTSYNFLLNNGFTGISGGATSQAGSFGRSSTTLSIATLGDVVYETGGLMAQTHIVAARPHVRSDLDEMGASSFTFIKAKLEDLTGHDEPEEDTGPASLVPVTDENAGDEFTPGGEGQSADDQFVPESSGDTDFLPDTGDNADPPRLGTVTPSSD